MQFLIPISLVGQEAMQRRCLMAAANVHFTEYVNVFLPSSKVSADVAHRTFAGAQPAARSRPQPSEPDTARQPQGLLRQPSISRNSRRKLSCALPGLRLRQLHQPAESLRAALRIRQKSLQTPGKVAKLREFARAVHAACLVFTVKKHKFSR